MCDGKIYLYNAKLNIAREESVRIFHCSRALLRFNSRWDSIACGGLCYRLGSNIKIWITSLRRLNKRSLKEEKKQEGRNCIKMQFYIRVPFDCPFKVLAVFFNLCREYLSHVYLPVHLPEIDLRNLHFTFP